jgi:hypothetical protein
MEQTQEKDYIQYYEDFMAHYSAGQTSGEEVGAAIARLAGYYCSYNNIKEVHGMNFFRRAGEIYSQTDETTGKAISAAKAEVLVKDTPEYTKFSEYQTHIENIEQYINALKSLQKGVLNEFSHSSLI